MSSKKWNYQPKYPGGKWDWRIPGFQDALTEALSPHVDIEPVWSLAEMEEKVGTKITKVAKGFDNDPRNSAQPTVIQARMLVEDFVTKTMDAISAGCYEKPWLYKVNFTGPLFACAMHQFGSQKVFGRVLAPALEKYIEDGIFTWAEEERVSKGFQDALESCGCTSVKKAVNHLQKAYDEAYFKAPYGSHRHPQPEIGMLQDFIKGWMQEFVNRGSGCIPAEKNQEVTWIALLFQNLCSPERACLPHELTSMIKEPPKSPWDFINQCAMECWMDYAPQANPKTAAKKANAELFEVPAGLPPQQSAAALQASLYAQHGLYAQSQQGLHAQQIQQAQSAASRPY